MNYLQNFICFMIITSILSQLVKEDRVMHYTIDPGIFSFFLSRGIRWQWRSQQAISGVATFVLEHKCVIAWYCKLSLPKFYVRALVLPYEYATMINFSSATCYQTWKLNATHFLRSLQLIRTANLISLDFSQASLSEFFSFSSAIFDSQSISGWWIISRSAQLVSEAMLLFDERLLHTTYEGTEYTIINW